MSVRVCVSARRQDCRKKVRERYLAATLLVAVAVILAVDFSQMGLERAALSKGFVAVVAFVRSDACKRNAYGKCVTMIQRSNGQDGRRSRRRPLSVAAARERQRRRWWRWR